MKVAALFLMCLMAGSHFLSAQTLRPRKLVKMIESSEVFNNQFTGFALYELDKRKMVATVNSDKYFTPASNTKLFTLYASLKMLKDSIAGLQYVVRGDSLIFWGTGDPTFLDPDYPEQKVLAFLRASGKNLYWAKGRYNGNFFGAGWAYDDYTEYYQPEISDLPVYGNIIRFRESNGVLESVPAVSSDGPLSLRKDQVLNGPYRVVRDLQSNTFRAPMVNLPAGYTQKVPFKAQASTIGFLLGQNLENFCGEINYPIPDDAKTIYSVPSDTLYRNLMLPSDNFIAEQLLLNIAASNKLEMQSSEVIKVVTERYLQGLPDRPVWADGSGLSRMNMFTPESIVKLCEFLYLEVGEDRLFNLLPQGGKTGTIKNLYKSDKPFVFAKTGSLNFTSTLSGFLVTKSGKRLIFSFMNNNFVRPSSEIRTEMEKVLTEIHKRY